MDELILEYAAKLQDIYDKRTAGDYTFKGFLSDFVRETQKVFADEQELAAHNPFPEV